MKNQFLSRFVLSFLILGLSQINLFGQEKISDVECGDRIESTFSKKKEFQDFHINLDGGDNLKVYASSKYGEYLKLWLNLVDPNNRVLKKSKGHKSVLQFETGIIPGIGTYIIRVYNNANTTSGNGGVGDYNLHFKCEKSDGTVISNNGNENQSMEIVSEKTQFISIPFGTPIEGEITPNSNQIFGFKTKVNGNTSTNFKVNISEGNLPLDIQIVSSSDNSVIFYSSLGKANSLEAKITFDKSDEYIVTVKESPSGNGNRKTNFSIILQ